MKLLVPLNSIDWIDEMILAGADEFYAGFYDDEWAQQYGSLSEINRMSGLSKRANNYTLSEICNIGCKLKQMGKSLYITLNAPFYSESQLSRIADYISLLSTSSVEGIIVSCPAVAQIGVKAKMKVVCSTMCGIYNEDILDFYYDIGVNKIIFPRDMTIKEISTLTEHRPDLQYEVFLMRNGCTYSDSNCLCMHRIPYRSLCGEISHAERKIISSDKTFQSIHDRTTNSFLYHSGYRAMACGLCALYDFLKIGITSGKIVGRADDHQFIAEDVRLVAENLVIAQSSKNRNEYLENMKMPKYASVSCLYGYSCYYPEIRFNT